MAIDDIVKEVVQTHFEEEAEIETVIWLPHGADNEIRLIEISPLAIPSGTVSPFPFAPTDAVPFRMLIADLTPKEWAGVQRGEIKLPRGWSLEGSRRFSRNGK